LCLRTPTFSNFSLLTTFCFPLRAPVEEGFSAGRSVFPEVASFHPADSCRFGVMMVEFGFYWSPPWFFFGQDPPPLFTMLSHIPDSLAIGFSVTFPQLTSFSLFVFPDFFYGQAFFMILDGSRLFLPFFNFLEEDFGQTLPPPDFPLSFPSGICLICFQARCFSLLFLLVGPWRPVGVRNLGFFRL